MPTRTTTELVSIFREDYVSVTVYRNTVDAAVYYDIVVSRLIWQRGPDGSKRREWKRGANFKPDDLPKIRRLLEQAEELLLDEHRLKDTKPDTSVLS
jgi:hypothetical protein